MGGTRESFAAKGSTNEWLGWFYIVANCIHFVCVILESELRICFVLRWIRDIDR